MLHQVSNDFVTVLIPQVSGSILISANKLRFRADNPIWSQAGEQKTIHQLVMGLQLLGRAELSRCAEGSLCPEKP